MGYSKRTNLNPTKSSPYQYQRRRSHFFWSRSSRKHCHINRINGIKVTVTKPLKEIESLLPKIFLRVHKSYIINISFIEKINTTNKLITLHFRTGLFEITEKSKIRLDETFTIKDSIVEIPVGEIYLEKVKHVLLTSKSL